MMLFESWSNTRNKKIKIHIWK